MRLVTLPLSPFGRKAHIVALMKRVDVEIVKPASLADLASDPLLGAKNPLAKIPFLLLDDGRVLYDSPVICEYLDSAGIGDALIPAGPERFAMLTRAALADGIMDAAVVARQEMGRAEGERSQAYLDKQRNLIRRAVAAAATDLAAYGADMRLDGIALAVVLTYLDLRHVDLDWRGGAPGLANWHAGMERHPHFVATRPSV